MTKLSVTPKRLREEAENGDFCARENLTIIEQIERIAWHAKKPRMDQAIPLEKIASAYGLPFALWALRCAEQEKTADLVGRMVALDMAKAGLDAHPETFATHYRDFLHKIEAYVLGGADLEPFRPRVSEMARLSNTYSSRGWPDSLSNEIEWLLLGLLTRSFFGEADCVDPEGDFSLSGLYCAPIAVDDLAFLLIRATPEFKSAKRVAEMAKNIEHRWQEGTRLEFSFYGDEIEQAIDALDTKLAPAAEELAWSTAKASWEKHLGYLAKAGWAEKS